MFAVHAQLMFGNFCVYFLVQLAVIFEDSVHFFELLGDKVSLLYNGFHGDTSSGEHLVDGHKLLELRVIDHLFEFLDLVLQRDH